MASKLNQIELQSYKQFESTVLGQSYKNKMDQLRKQIVTMCLHIEQQLGQDQGEFPIEALQTKDWYLSVVDELFPELREYLDELWQVDSDAEAIDELIVLLTEHELVEEDFCEIKGADIAQGDMESTYYMVQMLVALLEGVTSQRAEEEEEEASQSGKEKSSPKSPQAQPNQANSATYQSQPQTTQPLRSLEAGLQTMVSEKSHPFSQMRSSQPNAVGRDDESSSQRKSKNAYHSVLGIDKEFESEDEEDSQQEKEDKGDEDSQQDGSEHLEATKHVQRQPNSANYRNQRFGGNGKRKASKNKNMVANPQQRAARVLVKHPTIKQHIPKAQGKQAKVLTLKANQLIANTQKAIRNQAAYPQNTTQALLGKKQDEVAYALSEELKDRDVKQRHREKYYLASNKSELTLNRLLDRKARDLRDKQENFRKAVASRAQRAEQGFLKQMNLLIVELEREKLREEKKLHREMLLHDNQAAMDKLMALESWYRNQVAMMNEKRRDTYKRQALMRLGHREILSRIERDLKKDSELRLQKEVSAYKLREQRAQQDFGAIREQITAIYKKY